MSSTMEGGSSQKPAPEVPTSDNDGQDRQSVPPPPTGVVDGDLIDVADVIDIEEEIPESPSPTSLPDLTPQQGLCLAVFLAITIVVPLVFFGTSRVVDGLAVITFVPALGAFLWASRPKQRSCVPLLNLFGKFAFGWLAVLPLVIFFAAMAVILLMMLLTLLFAVLHLHSPLLFFFVVTSIISLAVVATEEVMKYLVVCKKDSLHNVVNPRRFVLYSLFNALGLATGEAFFLCLMLRRIFDAIALAEAGYSDRQKSSDHVSGAAFYGGAHRIHGDSMSGSSQFNYYADGGDGTVDFNGRVFSVMATTAVNLHHSFTTAQWHHHGGSSASSEHIAGTHAELTGADDFFIILVSCIFFFIPMHVLSGYHMGLGVARAEVLKERMSGFNTVIVPLIFRFFFFYVLTYLTLITPYIGLTAFFILPAYIWLVRRDEMKMPRSYLMQAGYMNAFGYGVLAESDEGDEPNNNAPSGHEIDLEEFNEPPPSVATAGSGSGRQPAGQHSV